MPRNIDTCESPIPTSVAPVVATDGVGVHLDPGYTNGHAAVLQNWNSFYLFDDDSLVVSNVKQSTTTTKKLFFEVVFTKVFTSAGVGPFIGLKDWVATDTVKNSNTYVVGDEDFFQTATPVGYLFPGLKTGDAVLCYVNFELGATTIGYMVNGVDYGIATVGFIPENAYQAIVGLATVNDVAEGTINFGSKITVNTPPVGYAGWDVVSTFDEFVIDSALTLSNGNMTVNAPTGSDGFAQVSKSCFEGKFYIELHIDSADVGNLGYVGISNTNQFSPADGDPTNDGTVLMLSDGTIRIEGGVPTAYGSALTAADDILIYFDAQAGTVGFIQNATDHGTITATPSLTKLLNYFIVGNRTSNTGAIQYTINSTIVNTPPVGYVQVNLETSVFDEQNYLSKSLGFSDQDNHVYSNSMLTVAMSALAASNSVFSRMFTPTGLWHAEVTIDSAADLDMYVGIASVRHSKDATPGGSEFSIALKSDGFVYRDGSQFVNIGRPFVATDIVAISLDQVNKTIAFNINDQSWSGEVPYQFFGPVSLIVGRGNATAKTLTINYGATAFSGSPRDDTFIAWNDYYNSTIHAVNSIVNSTVTQFPRLMYSNIAETATVSVSSESAEHLKEDSYDGLIGTYWEPEVGGDNFIKFEFAAPASVNTFGIFGHTLGDVGATVQLFGSADDITYVPITQISEPVSTELIYLTVENQSYLYYKLDVTSLAPARIGAIIFGVDAIFQHQNEPGFTPPIFNLRAKLNPQGKSSDVAYQVARTVKYRRSEFKLPSNDMTRCWADTHWIPILASVRIKPYLYFHDQLGYPNEGMFCYSENTIAPTPYVKGWELSGSIPSVGYVSTPGVREDDPEEPLDASILGGDLDTFGYVISGTWVIGGGYARLNQRIFNFENGNQSPLFSIAYNIELNFPATVIEGII